jgi:hypothetical protein
MKIPQKRDIHSFFCPLYCQHEELRLSHRRVQTLEQGA